MTNASPMRVLHLTRDFPPRYVGGLSTAVGGLVEASRAAGVACGVVSFDAWRPTRKGAGPPVNAGDVLHVTGPEHLPAVTAFGRSFLPDVVHVHDAMLWDAAKEIVAACAHRPLTVLTVHVAHGVLRALRNMSEPTTSERALEVAVSEADRLTVPCEGLLPLYPHDPHASVTPFGTVLPNAPATAAARGGVLFAGRLADIKGVDELIGAMAVIVGSEGAGSDAVLRQGARVSRVQLRIAGGMPENRKAERRRRKRFETTASAEVVAATTWLGWLDREALAAELGRAAMLVAPSWHETFGLTVLEAMAAGLPVVASDVPGHASLIEHGRTGWLVPPRDVRALAASLTELLQRPELRAELASAARAEVEKRFCWDTVWPAWRESYE